MTTDAADHHSESHDPTRHARCICGAHLSAPTTAAHEAHVAEATRATA